MNKATKYIVLLLLAALSLPTWAAGKSSKRKKNNDDAHGVVLWGGAGYSALLGKSDHSNLIGGGGGILGVGYQYQHKHFIINVGPEFRLFSSKDKLVDLENPYNAALPSISYDGSAWVPDDITKHYNFSKFREQQLLGQITVPVLFGIQQEKWYAMAGAKVGYTLLHSLTQTSNFTTSVSDPNATADEWFNLYGHDIQSHTYKHKGSNPFGLDLTVSAEAGIMLDQWLPDSWKQIGEKEVPIMRYRLGAFIDYGVMNMQVKSNKADKLIKVDADNVYTVSEHKSEWASNRLNSLLVGAKFTVFFQLTKPKQKKQPNPRMVIRVEDERTNRVIVGSRVGIYNERTRRTQNKTVNQKGMIVARYAAGNYTLTATANNYLPRTESVLHERDAQDTIILALTPMPILHVRVVNAKTEEGISAQIEFQNRESGQTVQTGRADSENGLTARLKPELQYNMVVSSMGYREQTVELDTVEADLVVRLNPIERGKRFKIENLFFASNETVILPESEPSMQALYEFLSENPDYRIRIIGHTDSVGTDEDNQILSEGRANSVRQSMIDRGIDPNRIEAEGHGETEPVATNETEEGRQLNRRVEFIVL